MEVVDVRVRQGHLEVQVQQEAESGDEQQVDPAMVVDVVVVEVVRGEGLLAFLGVADPVVPWPC